MIKRKFAIKTTHGNSVLQLYARIIINWYDFSTKLSKYSTGKISLRKLNSMILTGFSSGFQLDTTNARD